MSCIVLIIKSRASARVRLSMQLWRKACSSSPLAAEINAWGKIKASGYDQRWIVDVDDKTLLSELEDYLSEHIVDVIETAQGCHFITKKFDSETFKEFFEDVDIHKDNPTLLYYAENGRKDL